MAQGQRNSNNVLAVPQGRNALEQLKFEVASEQGIHIPEEGYYGKMATPDTGSYVSSDGTDRRATTCWWFRISHPFF